MRTIAAPLLCLMLLAASASARAEALPRPDGLAPQVRFWTRIYSEVDTGGGLIHDARHLDVVYEVVRIPRGLSQPARERQIEQAKRKYVAALERLGSGRRSDLSATEQHVLALWPRDVSNATLRAAAREVRFQLGQADKFREGVIRAGLWEPHIREVLARHGVPADVAALPHVESSFNPHAYSSAGAAGLWQFTGSTGRLYMRVDYEVDERFDPYKSSEAAARLLLDNYRELGTWPLAITAYNHGRGGMERAVRTLGTRDIAQIVPRYQGPAFKFASRNFYTELLAAIDVERDAAKHFGPLPRRAPAEYQVVDLDHYYHVASLERAFGIDAAELREHNLSLRSPVWRGQKYVPRGYRLRIPREASGAPAATALAAIPAGERFSAQKRDTVYKVERGDTLSVIARRFGVGEQELASMNGLRSRHQIRVGQVLRLPTGAAPSAPVTVAATATAAADFDGSYRVRPGDTLSGIARRFGVGVADLTAANGLRDRDALAVGQALQVPAAGTRVAAAAPPAGAPAAVASPAAQPAPEPAAEAAVPPPTPPAPTASLVAGEPPAPVEPAGPALAANLLAATAPRAGGRSHPAIAAVATAAPEVASSPGAAPVAAAPAQAGALPALGVGSDLGIGSDDRIAVEPGETLGHYAEWLEVTTSRLRSLNGLRTDASIVIGQRVRLDFSRVSRDTFAARRLDHHDGVRKEFFASYRVAGTRTHVLRPGDTLWSLSRSNRSIPIWLLRQYNPDLDLGDLRPGERIEIPQLEHHPT